MLDLDAIGKNIRTLVRELLAMPANSVRPADQNAPTGTVSDQFATVRVLWVNQTGDDDLVRANGAGTSVTETITGQRQVLASVNFFRGDAYTKAARLPALLSSSLAIERMQQLGLGLVNTSQARNLTAFQDTLREQRGQIDLTFHVISSETVTVQTYGEFDFAISTADENGVTTTQAFEVFEP